METQTGQQGNRVLVFAETHPYMLLAAIVVLVLIILVLMFGGSIPGIPMRQKMKERLEDENEIDTLIESIHNKQKQKKKTAP